MAQTTQRVIELVIKLQGAQSLEELEKVTEEINDELKQVGENSEAFKELGKLANDAVKQVKKVDNELSQVTAQEKTEAIRKVGEGLVGAFQVAAGASLFFGKKTSEELEKVIAKVGGLFNIVDGLDKVSKVFSANNIKALKATVKGFQESAVAAKLFGTTTKTAIAATGIGLVVVILASIIANFDKVKVAAKKAFDGLKDAFPFFEKIQDFVDDIKERFGSLGNIIKGIGAAIASIFTKQTMKEAFDEAIESAMELDAITKEYQEIILNTNDEFENQKTLLNEIGGKEQEILDLEKERYQQIVDILRKKERYGELTEDEAKALEDANFQLQLLGIRQTNLNKKREEEARIAAEKAAADKKAADEKAAADKKAAEDRQKAIDDLNAEIKARKDLVELNEKIFKRELGAIIFNNEVKDLTEEQAQKLNDIYVQQLKILKNEIDSEEILKQAIQDNEELVRLEQDRLNILEDLNAGLLTVAQADKLFAENAKAKTEYETDLYETSQNILSLISEENKRKLIALTIQQDALRLQKEYLQTELNNAAIQLESAETEEEKVIAKEKILDLSKQIADVSLNIVDINKDINDILADNTKELAGQAVTQKTLNEIYSDGLEKFFTKYGELIGATRDLTNAVFDLAIQNAEKEAEAEIERLEAVAKADIEIQEGVIDEKKKLQEDYTNSINELYSLLADAEGERYEDILAQIELEKQAKQQAIDDEVAAEQAKADIEAQLLIDKQEAEKKANQLKKTQAIVQAVIDTALAILSALKSGFPLGLIMAGVYGAMGAVQIATISKQPVYAEGGFTGIGDKYEPAGIVHKGEYVVPQRVVRNPQATAMLETLEGMRLRGYAEGGAVTSIPNIPDTENMLDYARIGNEVARALKENPMFVSWTEWRDTDAKARWVLNRAGFGKD